jgi:HPt (histidine-containing phosphotransfer) domain-containing protein
LSFARFVSPTELDETLEALRRRYLASFPEKRASLAAAWQVDRADTTRASLYRLAHRLAGSAGAYGIAEVSHAAARLEQLLLEPAATVDQIGHALGEVDEALACAAPPEPK